MNDRAKYQPREGKTGQFGFVNDWGRKCVCGHELGVHSGEAPHDCLNIDRRGSLGTVNLPDWVDQTIEPSSCDCLKFRPVRVRKPRMLPNR